MREFLIASFELLAYLVGAAGLAAIGLFAELNSLSYLSAGNTVFAAWLAVMGAIALYGAFSIGTEKLLPKVREIAA